MDPELASAPHSRAVWPGVLLAVLLALVLIAGGIYWSLQKHEATTEIAPGENLATAATGTIVRGFPIELILEPSVNFGQSYRIDYAAGNISQPVATYTSAKSFSENFETYRNYFTSHGWRVLNEDKSEPVGFLYAQTTGAAANVTFQKMPGSVSVTIAYTKK
jgi:hypothetical protein